MKIIWLIANCNSQAEATKIGQAVLKKRWAACYDIIPRTAAGYFWPPQKGKMTKGRGTTLLLSTLPRHLARISVLVKKLHSDKIPFIGAMTIDHVTPEYYHWLTAELSKHV